MNELTHINQHGKAAMVDVSAKDITSRQATAQGRITMQPATLALIANNQVKKGDVLAVANIAAVQAAKKTWDLIPLCHALPLAQVLLAFELDTANNCVIVNATAKTTAQTGVEMEALTAVSVACLTIYDMCKAADKAMMINDIKLTHKKGGRSGEFFAV